MNMISEEQIKEQTRELGAYLCGIASVERFCNAPAGFHPADILKSCESVIVIAARYPISPLSSTSLAVYTFTNSRVINTIDSITFQLCDELERLGACAVAIPASEPYEYWDEQKSHGRGILSLKHSAVLAGLGQMGKNTLLINDQLGSMLNLGAVLVDAKLTPDPPASYESCIPDCRLCLDSCPAHALDGITIEQRKCRTISAKCSVGGGFVYGCNLCRKICPHHQGLKLMNPLI